MKSDMTDGLAANIGRLLRRAPASAGRSAGVCSRDIGPKAIKDPRSLPRPDAQLFELLHRLIGELSLWSVAPDDEHDDRVFAGLGCLDILESPDRSGWKRNNVERIEIDRLDIAFFVLP